MKRKTKVILILSIICLLYIKSSYGSQTTIGKVIERNTYIQVIKDLFNENSNIEDGDLVLVNRKNVLDKDYVPDGLKVPNIRFYSTVSNEEMQMKGAAADALEKLFGKSEQEDIMLYALSGYRSYKMQKELYEDSVKTKGKQYTYNYVANPGRSEHQSGLAMDITNAEKSTGFEYTKEGIWLKNNAHKFGFIVRYGKDKEAITGYSYEPWHIRYVGTKNSEEIYLMDITLEEFLKS